MTGVFFCQRYFISENKHNQIVKWKSREYYFVVFEEAVFHHRGTEFMKVVSFCFSPCHDVFVVFLRFKCFFVQR